MQPYSQDLRDRVFRALERGGGPTEIARRFRVGRRAHEKGEPAGLADSPSEGAEAMPPSPSSRVSVALSHPLSLMAPPRASLSLSRRTPASP